MSHLLHVVKVASVALQKKNVVPLLMEFEVNPVTSPFLVTSTTSLLWVEEAFPGDVVRVAVRKGVKDVGVLYREILEAVKKRGQTEDWGNVSPGTPDGVKAAIEYVKSYDIEKVEILARPKSGLTHKTFGAEIKPTSWLPEGCFVVVPKDRLYLGRVSMFGRGTFLAVLHNPARGLALAWGDPA